MKILACAYAICLLIALYYMATSDQAAQFGYLGIPMAAVSAFSAYSYRLESRLWRIIGLTGMVLGTAAAAAWSGVIFS
ncbi:hypothetical protein B6J05_19265 [Klebsiella quasipneumoniae]|uniref:hypothetical protein n=1 Tax=Enterobacteriaceae TaxID=543 RepID=UPI0005F8B649|nr:MULTISPECIES: hypothetical protein [Enterobacteriaceae]KJW77596.1 hypothetical protein SG67_20660 [Enterobacter asburiae]KJW88656.1 hypothetical protein SG65_22660 [Enterobacter hormaechei subsp. steigerwaltii]KJX07368.1 hypothetical protein SG66_20475 [Enterobacter asburiae]KJX16120.1 hypothetical protein SG64_19995 [Enterobacter hormaechei subsp. xiangfangensis]PLG16291.1 hypothetical protein B6J05_19265 [Klebsiella quasipneumoniae]